MSDKPGRKAGVQKPQKRKKKKHAAAAATAAADAAGPAGSVADVPQSTAEAKPSVGAADEIDSIFARRPRKHAAVPGLAEASSAEKPKRNFKKTEAASAESAMRPSAAVKGSKDDIFAEGPAKSRRVDEEGLPIYSTEELNVGKGGSTAACPFDCECCF